MPSRRSRSILAVAGVLLLLAALAWRALALRPLVVDGSANTPTLLWGDLVIVDYGAYEMPLPGGQTVRWGAPARGDMVLADMPGAEAPGLRRVVGLPGDTIELRAHQLIVNGTALAQQPDESDRTRIPSVNHPGGMIMREHGLGMSQRITYNHGMPAGNFGPLRVPAGHYFLLGDQRDRSRDSRVFGPLPAQRLQARLLLLVSRNE